MDDFQTKASLFLGRNAKAIVIVFVAIVVIGGGFTIITQMKSSSEEKAQDEFAKIERALEKAKDGFSKAEVDQKQPVKDPKKPDLKLALPTGDFEKDYGVIAKSLEDFIPAHQGTNAAIMASLTLSDLYFDHKKKTEARAILEKVKMNSGNLLSLLASHRLATFLSDDGKCPEARERWDKLSKEAPQFIRKEIKLRTALCFEQEGQIDKAKALYSEVSKDHSDMSQSSVSKDAEKYLRYLNFKSPATKVGQNEG